MPAEIERRLAALSERVQQAGRVVEAGDPPGIAELHDDVETVCRDLAAAPREDARRHLARLEALVLEIDALDSAMRRRLDALSNEMQQHGTRQTAVRAYGRGGPCGGAAD